MASFQIKNFVSIVASMINWMKSTQTQITDFNEGAIARTLVEAPAAEIEELYRKMLDGLVQAIPVATYNSFNFNALPAEPTSGLVRVIIQAQGSAVTIAAGTTFTYQNGAVSYTSDNDTTIAAGNTYGDVLVTASQAGSLGNLAANTQFTLSPAPAGFVSASNLSPWINGTDTETEQQRQLRFSAYIQTLARATVVAIGYGLSTVQLTDSSGNVIERVASSQVIEPYETDNTQPIGLINCYIHNGVGNTSAALVTQALQVIYGYTDSSGNKVPGWKAAGTHVNVYAATELHLNIAGTLTALPGYDKPTLDSSANQTAIAYITGLAVGVEFEVSELIKRVKLITGVDDFIPADVVPPGSPVLGSTAGGTLPATTYYAAISYVTAQGETLLSPTASLAVAANNLLTVASPAVSAGVTGWNLYAGTSPSSLTKQNTAQLGIGSSYTEPTSGLVSGAAPPTVSTARLVNFTPAQSQKLMPGTVAIA
jgi:hypothetical protein